ncbi:3-phosphoshikimate 1-carboxyvinyltransferase [Klebsiella michiganensis]|uniref:3-phosphoshikimate 1-carboxyvinyltransferase n=1 Tax=Klebsiella michiganensis TaxID=1134687 RepID=A0A7H4N2M0_9ENTR|nr:3-phosphoshikimate 1-carboxyvinyltransferase [Klebsiella michiganensis]
MKVTGIGRNSVQGDIRFADVLEKMGATVTWGDDFIACTHGELNAIDMGYESYSGCGDDHRHGGPVREGPHDAAQHL